MNLKLARAVLAEDSSGIRHNIPGVKYGIWEINSLGFRGKEVDLKKKEGQIRILCLGGSETFGVFESKDREWPSQLGEMLRNQFPRAEVINASVAGLTLKRKKAYVEKYVLPLKPDIMITTQGALLPITDLMRGVQSKRLGSKVKRKKFLREFVAENRVLLKLGETIKKGLPVGLSTYLRLWRLRSKIRKKERKHLANKQPMDKLPEHIILEFEEDLRSFTQYLKENHIVPILLTYPTLFTNMNKCFYRYLLLSIRRLCVELSDDGVIDASEKFNDSIRRMAEKQNVALIDNDHLMPKTLEYFVDYSHYTDKGAEFIAKNIHHFLNHSGLIK
jgi:lysophospholipase L1-like esterase